MRIEDVNPGLEYKVSHVVEKEAHQERALQEPLKRIQEEQKKAARGELDKEELKDILNKFNRFLDAFNIQLKFKLHEETKTWIVRVVDVENDRVIREIPPEKILDMFAKMMELMGIIFDERV
ncbi:MAG: flagellar protein FlaG [Synergistetes bacterium]|nr:flagellar protein FlaG [Synergistota bacterium]MDK2872105.1 flagellar protein FlaG [bacterium]